MINDLDPTQYTWTDQDIQDFCDRANRRVEVMPPYQLQAVPTMMVGGTTQWFYFFAPFGDWENNVVLQDQSWNVIDPTSYSEELITGKWTFNTSISIYGHYPPVYIHGYYYDLYAIAADILDEWSGKVMLQISFGAGGSGDKFHANQKLDGLITVSRNYRKLQRGIAAPLRRHDINV